MGKFESLTEVIASANSWHFGIKLGKFFVLW